MKALNRFYLDHPAFSEEDYDRTGFKWIECSAQEQCVYAFERRSAKSGSPRSSIFQMRSRSSWRISTGRRDKEDL